MELEAKHSKLELRLPSVLLSFQPRCFCFIRSVTGLGQIVSKETHIALQISVEDPILRGQPSPYSSVS